VPDVLIVGGGVMGLACAWRLAQSGARTLVLERSVPGAEASSAAAGILGAHAEAHAPGPFTRLMLASARRHAAWAAELGEATGIDVGHRINGILRIATTEDGRRDLVRRSAWMRRERGMRVVALDARAARRLEPALDPVAGGLLYPRDGRIDPPLFFRALHVAAERAGVTFQTGAYVASVARDGERATGVVLEDGSTRSAGAVVLAAGSWTSLVEGTALPRQAVVPARGQIVQLVSPSPVLDRIVLGPDCYIVPRDDGRSLVGSTLEFVGYRKEVTAQAMRDLLTAALRLVPKLGEATVHGAWSNFRPYTRDELPLLGPSPVEGLHLATGHHRNGILLAPITAECVTAGVLGRRSPVSLAPFSPKRRLAI
jgi:glycine oxidase